MNELDLNYRQCKITVEFDGIHIHRGNYHTRIFTAFNDAENIDMKNNQESETLGTQHTIIPKAEATNIAVPPDPNRRRENLSSEIQDSDDAAGEKERTCHGLCLAQLVCGYSHPHINVVVATDVGVNYGQDARAEKDATEADSRVIDATSDFHSATPDRRRTMLPRLETEAKHVHDSKLARSHSSRALEQTDAETTNVSTTVRSTRMLSRTQAAEVEKAKSEKFSVDQSAVQKKDVLRSRSRGAMLPQVKADNQHKILDMSTPTATALSPKSLELGKPQETFAGAQSGVEKVIVSLSSRRRKILPPSKAASQLKALDKSVATATTLPSRSRTASSSQPIPGIWAFYVSSSIHGYLGA